MQSKFPRRSRYLRCDGGGPAATFAGVLIFAAGVALVIIRLASPGTFNYFFDKDERKIMPPQYLIQIPSGYALGGQFYSTWHDDKNAKDYSDYWRMVEDTEAPLSDVSVYAPGNRGGAVRLPIRIKGGPFYTYRDLRAKLTNLGIKQVKLHGSGDVVEGRLSTRRNP